MDWVAGAFTAASLWVGGNVIPLLSLVVATGAFLLSINTRNRQVASERPSLMAIARPVKNGVVLAMTLRNRANHPIMVKHIQVENAELQLAAIAGREEFNRETLVKSERTGNSKVDLGVTLNSAGHSENLDRMQREYAILSHVPLPKKFWVSIHFDPNGPRRATHTVRQEVEVTADKVGHVTAVPPVPEVMYSLSEPRRAK